MVTTILASMFLGHPRPPPPEQAQPSMRRRSAGDSQPRTGGGGAPASGSPEPSSSGPLARPLRSTSEAIQGAEMDILQSIGLFGNESSSQSSQQQSASALANASPALRGEASKELGGRRWRGWTPSAAIFTTRVLLSIARYPIGVASTHAQLTGNEVSLLSFANIRKLARGALPLGLVYRWNTANHLGLAAAATSYLFPVDHGSIYSLALNISTHYLLYALAYGLFRQSTAAQIAAGEIQTAYPGSRALAAPALAWARDYLLLRRPRGSPFAVYLRDLCGNILQSLMSSYIMQLLTSQTMAPLYGSIISFVRSSQGLLASLRMHTRGSPPPPIRPAAGRRTARRRPASHHYAHPPASSAMTNGALDSFDIAAAPQSDPLVQCIAEHPSPDSLCIYLRSVATIFSEVLIMAVMYPLNSAVVRLFADEIGVTNEGYSGLANCLHRSIARDPGSLFAGFSSFILSEAAVAWAACEVAHFLCKLAR